MRKPGKRTELVTFRLSRIEKENLLEVPSELLGCPQSDLVRLALREFSIKGRHRQRHKPLEKPGPKM